MQWERLLSTKRNREGTSRKSHQSQDLRSEFEKDYHRIIGSASFRRLQDKTQVFPLDQSDFIRTRLTHSLEVSSFGKSLGQNIGENIIKYQKDPTFTQQMKEDICNILQCAGLIHDIGNPPFGHFGELAIREWFERNLPLLQFRGKSLANILSPQMKEDFYHFEGNAQALRLVSKLHFLVDENGMNLTYALLNTIIKYPSSSTEVNPESGYLINKKIGYYYADQELFADIQRETGTCGRRHPLTFILEAADDIAYNTADVEDAFVKGFISYHQISETLKELQKEDLNEVLMPFDKLEQLYNRGCALGLENPEEYAIKNWLVRIQSFLITCATYEFTSNYESIMEGTYNQDLFGFSYGAKVLGLLGELAVKKVFTSAAIYKMEVAESRIIDYLLTEFIRAVISYDDDTQSVSSIDMRLVSFISDNYKTAYHHHAKGKSETEKLYLRLLLVTDYICGMTDSYAKRLFQELNEII